MNYSDRQHFAIRDMEITDLEQVVMIETSVSQSPWSTIQFQQSLNESMVLVVAGQIIGFSVVAIIGDEAEVHNLAVHPDHQGLGFGSVLLDHIIAHLPVLVSKMHLEVRTSNFPAIRLYLQKDFVPVGERLGYYKTEHGREDAVLMSRPIKATGH
ncbi:MAG: ribosomal protein S18-alanine N-acetyltransferase [Porticoccaceae bacterium]|nr:ribosomal protein S18-alanine N-acetyltransferase [Porticoccaceae bacterium]